MRRSGVYVLTGLLVGMGCSLLNPYPGGGDPAEILADSKGPGGGSPINCVPGFDCEAADPNPLVDPATDSSISAVSPLEFIVAVPGESFTVDLEYVADNRNVVGGGIKFPGAEGIQWTFIEQLEGTASGQIRFGFAVDGDICDELPPLCHEIATEQFAVGRNTAPDGDVDGDGDRDGEFVVSEAVELPVILRCASCGSPSCREIPGFASECLECGQPPGCQEVFAACFAEGQPRAGTQEARDFDRFFGAQGIAWKSAAICDRSDPDGLTPAESLCEGLIDIRDECLLEAMGDTDTDTDGMMSDTDGMDMSTTG